MQSPWFLTRQTPAFRLTRPSRALEHWTKEARVDKEIESVPQDQDVVVELSLEELDTVGGGILNIKDQG